MQSLYSFVLLAVLASPALAQQTVSLLIDLPGYTASGTLPNLSNTLTQVSSRKGSPFRFGSTYDSYTSAQTTWAINNVAGKFFNHWVAENSCKWSGTEPSRGTSSLNGCKNVQNFASQHGGSFRGHNTFWHNQTPGWLPGSVSASDLVNNVIPQHVQQEISGMGSDVTSWDVVNEIVGDGVSNGLSAFQCVKQKNVWPTQTSDGSGQSLVTDLGFVHAAFSNALKYAPSSAKLAINDYNTGGNDAKTACMFQILADIVANAGVPYNRLAIGFQSHVSGSNGGFFSKSDLKNNLAKLAALGADGLITELDIKISGTSSQNLRFQAAIWGDYLDACLYASNCHEFVNWNFRDDQSWLGSSGAGTLFDTNGNPKPAAFEVAARLQRYAAGGAEMCATSLGSSQCKATAPSGTTTTGSTTTTTTSVGTTTTSTTSTTSTTPPSGCTAAMYAQCGGSGFTGCTTCASGSTCKYSNDWYSQCL